MTGLGIYATNVSRALNAPLISMRKDNRKGIKDYDGIVYNGIKTRGITSGYYINEKYQDLFYKKCEKYLKSDISSSSIIHYTNPGIKTFKLKVKTVVTFHDLFPILSEDKNKISAIKKKNFLRFKSCENIITISNTVKNLMIDNGFNKNDIEVIYHSVPANFQKLNVDKKELRRKLHLPVDKKLILSVSTNDPRKNLSTVKSTMEKLGDDFRLVRVGVSVGNSITMSNLNGMELNEVYNACDLLLIPSKDEGFGFPVIEAFASGIPVVCTDIPIFNEISKGATILSEDDPESLRGAVLEGLNKSDELISKGFEAAKFYSFDNFKANLRKYYTNRLQTIF
jgi:glycosyltransferase involved in cell wall biosynthesis